MPRRPETNIRVQIHVNDLCQNFGHYVQVFEEESLGGLEEYREALELLNGREVKEAIRSDECLLAIRRTLDAWNMNQRRARLVSRDRFIRAIRQHEYAIESLEDVNIADIDRGSVHRLWSSIAQLRLSETESQIVTVSKALHHLLPGLIPPIDGGYTKPFFSYHVTQRQDSGSVFEYVMPRFAEIARRVDPSQYVGRSEWATNLTKVMDNAIVGFGKLHRRNIPECCSRAPSLWQRN